MKMGHGSHRPGSQGDLSHLAPSQRSVPFRQPPVSPGSVSRRHLRGTVPGQAWPQRQLVGKKAEVGVEGREKVFQAGVQGRGQMPGRCTG